MIKKPLFGEKSTTVIVFDVVVVVLVVGVVGGVVLVVGPGSFGKRPAMQTT